MTILIYIWMHDTSHHFLAKNREKAKKDRNEPTSFFFKIFHWINILAPLVGDKDMYLTEFWTTQQQRV